jgi:hypothetical protein
MTYVPGSSAAALIRAGLSRESVVGALVTEIGLTPDQAQTAWDSEIRRTGTVLVGPVAQLLSHPWSPRRRPGEASRVRDGHRSHLLFELD